MPVTTIGSAGVIWGLSAESGIIAQSVSAKTTREKNQVRNESGEFVAVAFYNATQTFSVAGVLTGSSGLATAAPGVAMTLVNTAILNGVTQGLIVVDDVDVSKGNTEFKKISINATQYPLITS
jgi:hypothetical protein